MSGYAEDLAYIHDTAFRFFAERAAPGLLELLRARGIDGGLVVDLGCGSGIWARELLAAGYNVLGIDSSSAMIRLARKKAPGAGFRVASLWKAKLPACDSVTAISEVLNYRFDHKEPATLAALFRRIYEALRPGGVLIFDAAEPGRIPGGARSEYWQGDDWAVLLDACEDRRRRTAMRELTVFRRVGGRYRRSREVHKLKLYDPEALAALLRRTGFKVRLLRGYGACRLPQGHFAVVAWKADTTRA